MAVHVKPKERALDQEGLASSGRVHSADSDGDLDLPRSAREAKDIQPADPVAASKACLLHSSLACLPFPFHSTLPTRFKYSTHILDIFY